ncbi:hypothetical protein DICSQDRAFT_124135 [Dichomitus squalens LYAD-421 SS1]|uniref:uncharacterized protein n=1 Tax=Dichomitus squalens (strain LYAD-421) TaxID=732165 RepID=UPI00044155CF|nr:uncharacterized protein DICSQDRAFT_124135 [Dichomitus squalens LYAD-421 SS1]EJF66081.1 hypothetical protein DICSQDRAFT_124135 [Dichomitus squalens LYAD-421 SS1]
MRFASIVLLPLALASFVAAGPVAEKRASFTLSNGKEAQKLNSKFASLSADSKCSGGEVACIHGVFAKCDHGIFVQTPCGGGTQCFALPLVNSPGTSVTCTTEADAAARIQRTGATGGIKGRDLETRASFTLSNGKEAQALNRKFKGLTKNSSCKSDENACVDGEFAQCANGKFVLTPCNVGLKCFALPLVLSPGTSLVCDTQADAEARIRSTGAGGLFGREFHEFDSRSVHAPAACKAKKRDGLSERSEDAPLVRRIAQTDLGTLAQEWQNLCLKSGGDVHTNDPCVQLAGIRGINVLLANADPCEQQAVADAMVDFAKSKGIKNKSALVAYATKYATHPRNALNINGVVPSTPFCQRAPKNAELRGLSHSQLDGVDPGLFGAPNVDIFPFGQPGSCPFGKKPDVKTCSCH